MAEYIEKSDVASMLSKNGVKKSIVEKCVLNVPAANVRENVKGEWIKMDMHMGMENYKCSVCRSECYVPEVMGEPMFPLCPYCGAEMGGIDAD